jgi:hypothetical protein
METGLEDVVDGGPEMHSERQDDGSADKIQSGVVVEHLTRGVASDADDVPPTQPETEVARLGFLE